MYKKVVVAVLGLCVLIFFLWLVFSGSIVLPRFFMVGPLVVHYYGLIMACAVLFGYMLAVRRAGVYGMSFKEAERFIFWAVVVGFIFARLYHVFSSWQYYLAHPVNIIKVWNGGLGIFGALFGGIVVAILAYVYRERFFAGKNISLLRLLDWGAPAFVLGQIIGRFGNLFNYEAFGYPTGVAWKMFVPEYARSIEFVGYSFYHPVFLYEALGNIFVLWLLLRIEKNSSGQSVSPGAIFFTYLFLYNILRFLLEFLRIDSTFIGLVRLNSITSMVLAIAGLVGLLFVKYARKKLV